MNVSYISLENKELGLYTNLERLQPIVKQIMEDLFNVMQLKETAQKHENLGKTTYAYVVLHC